MIWYLSDAWIVSDYFLDSLCTNKNTRENNFRSICMFKNFMLKDKIIHKQNKLWLFSRSLAAEDLKSIAHRHKLSLDTCPEKFSDLEKHVLPFSVTQVDVLLALFAHFLIVGWLELRKGLKPPFPLAPLNLFIYLIFMIKFHIQSPQYFSRENMYMLCPIPCKYNFEIATKSCRCISYMYHWIVGDLDFITVSFVKDFYSIHL